MGRLNSTFTTITTALVLAGVLILLQQSRLQELADADAVLSSEELERQTSQESLRLAFWRRLPTLGFKNLVADWVFLNFLQYFGDKEVRSLTNYALSPDYLDTVLHKDPYFWDAYLFLSGSTSLYAGRPDRTIEVMETHLPKISPKTPDRSYFIWRWKATDELLFLGDAQAAQASHQTAADWASQYNTEEGQLVARSSRRTAEFLATNPNSIAVQISSWMTVYGNALDDATRAFVIERLQGLGAEVVLDENGVIANVIPPSS